MLCYNHEKFVAQSIESVLNQTYQNWELIIVDNASTDRSKERIENKINGDSRIVFLPQPYNKLVSLGTNIAIEKSVGEFIAILSADDFFASQKIEEQLKYMQNNDLDLSFTWIQTVNDRSEEASLDVQNWFNRPQVKDAHEILYNYFSFINSTCAPTALIKSSILVDTQLFDHRLLQTQDFEFWIRILQKTQKVSILHEKLTYYRVLEDGGNLSSNNSPIKINRTHFEMMHTWKQLFLLDNGLLSKTFNTEINDTNKYQMIYQHLDNNNLLVGQLVLLLCVFYQLGRNCDVQSQQFKFFFENYGKLEIRLLEIGNQPENNIIEKEQAIEALQKAKDWLDGQYHSLNAQLFEKNQEIEALQETKNTLILDLNQKDDYIKKIEDNLNAIKNTKMHKILKKMRLFS
jgi:glycosyltransferase involved in cell wall biosynthesis